MAKLIVGENDLQTWCENNGEWGQQLIDEWVGLDENGTNIELIEVTRASRRKVWWRCKEGHQWLTDICHRTLNNRGCPECAKAIISTKIHDNSLIKGVNDLYTWCSNNSEIGQKIMQEWVGKDIDNNDVNMSDINIGTRKKYYWKCTQGHIYLSDVHSKTRKDIERRTGCPYCNNSSTSYAEQLIYQALSSLYINCQNRYKDFDNIEYDIALIDEKIYIEYSPTFTHVDKQERDELKARLCIKNNIRFIYISDEFIYDTKSKKHIQIKNNNIDMLEALLNLLGHSISEINLEDIQSKAYRFSHGELVDNERIDILYPELAKEWHTDNIIDIKTIKEGSSHKVKWMCRNCNHTWETSVANRIKGKSGCPLCGYNWVTGNLEKRYTNVIKVGYNDLAAMHPELAKEWHPDNELKPTEIKEHSRGKFKWQCINCGYGKDGEWKAGLNSRNKRGNETGCPNCGYNWYKAQTGQPQKLKKMRTRSQVHSLSEFI